jgi:hypothetical protein
MTKDGSKTVMDWPSPRNQITLQRHMTLRRASLCRQLLYDVRQGQLLTLIVDHSVCQKEWDATVDTQRLCVEPVTNRTTHDAHPRHHDPQGRWGLR